MKPYEILAIKLLPKIKEVDQSKAISDAAIEAMKEYADQELKSFKTRLIDAIINKGDFRPYTITNLIENV